MWKRPPDSLHFIVGTTVPLTSGFGGFTTNPATPAPASNPCILSIPRGNIFLTHCFTVGTTVPPTSAFGGFPTPSNFPGFGQPVTPAQPQFAQAGQVEQTLALLAQLRYTGLKEEDLGELRTGDEYETEILLMSGVRALLSGKASIIIFPCVIPR